VSATTPGAGGPWANILEVATAIVSTMSWEETLNKIAEKMGSAMFAWSAGINSFDQERRLVTYEAYWCEGGSTEEDLAYIGNISSLDDRTDFKPIIEGRELVEWHVDDPGLSESDRELMKRWGLKSSLDAPLIYNDEVIGSAQIQETRYARKFTPIERSIFVQLCELASIGVHNAQENRARLETERRFAALAELGARLGAAQSPGEVATAVTAVVGSALPGSRVELGASAPQIGEAVVRRLGDTDLGEAAGPLPEEGAAVRLLVPVSLRGEPRALLSVSWVDAQRRVTEPEIEFARLVAAQVALGLGQEGFGGATA